MRYPLIGAARRARRAGVGRSRGGLTTKAILTADEDTAIAVEVLPGQARDAPRLEPLLDATLERVPPSDEAVCDRRFDRDTHPNIPGKGNRVEPQPLRPDGCR